jgi:4-amino-4-deoxy-L-arabinose transferase-like glycosyltransferase
MIPRETLIVLLLMAIAILGAVLVSYATPFGVGTSPDSVAYIGAAQNLRSGQGLTVPLGGFDSQPLTQFPPLYPLLLAISSLIGAEAYATARILSALLFGANVLLVGWILHRLAPQSAWAAVFASLGMLLVPVMLEIHVMAWSEPLFILLGLSALYALAVYLETASLLAFITAIGLTAAAFLTRYAGVVYLATGLLGILFLGSGKPNRRIRSAVVFGLAGALPVVCYLAYNQLVAGSATNREIAFHPVTRSQLWQGLTTFTGWLGIPNSLPAWLHGLIVLIGILLFGAALFLAVKAKNRSQETRPGAQSLPVMIQLLVLFVLMYGGFLLLSISFLDANTPLDNRILSPVYASLLIIGVYAATRLTAANPHKPLIRWSLVALAGLLVVNWLRLSLPTLSLMHNQGIGFSTPAWQDSALLDQLKALPTDVMIYSNAPDAVYLLAGRPAARLPRIFELSSQQENTAYPEEMQAVGAQMIAGQAVIAFFTSQGRQSNPSQEDLLAALDLEISQQFADGLIFTTRPTQP